MSGVWVEIPVIVKVTSPSSAACFALALWAVLGQVRGGVALVALEGLTIGATWVLSTALALPFPSGKSFWAEGAAFEGPGRGMGPALPSFAF